MTEVFRERLAASGDARAELVLLHGWASDSDIWRPLLPALRQQFSVTLVDLPGCGRSPALATANIDTVIDALLAVLPASAVIVGWSLGGMIASELARRYPERVAAVVRVASNTRFVATVDWPHAMPAETFEHFYRDFMATPQKTLRRFKVLQLQGDARARSLRRQMSAEVADAGAQRWGLDCLRELDQRQLVAELTCPVMNIYGDGDALLPVAAAALIPAQRSHCYTRAGHLPFLSQPQRFVDDLQDFVGQVLPECPAVVGERHFEKRDVARSFSRAAQSYDGAAVLQRRVADQLFSWLEQGESRPVERVVDLGCGTGYSLSALRAKYPAAQLCALDLAEGMLNYARRQHGEHCQQWLCGDAEDLPLADASVDVLFSSLSLQWCENLAALFSEIERVLRPGACAYIATLGPQTLYELREAWREVDGYQHVNDFAPREALVAAIAGAGLQPQWRRDTEVLYYPTLVSLTRELKELGVGNVNRDRPQGLSSRRRLQALQEAYEVFRVEGGLPASYQVWYLHLHKPLGEELC